MPRFSIRTVMVFIVATAVGLAAMRSPNEIWAWTMLVAALFAFGVAILGAVLLRGRERALWLGFGVFSGEYLFTGLIFLGFANQDAGFRISHSLFALLAGLVGRTVAGWFYSRREGDQAACR